MQTRKYRILNWPQYNKALIQRGSITFWLEEGAIRNWLSKEHTGKAGRPVVYSNEAILAMLIVREVFRLPLRALQGFVTSLFLVMGVTMPVPSYPRVCCRARTLGKSLRKLTNKRPKHVVFDSTELKVYGEGEWKVKVHGKSKRRTWRKFHIGLDPVSHDIVVCELTENNKGDAEVAAGMMQHLSEAVETVYGDGAYDGEVFRSAAYDRGIKTVVPPPRNASYKGILEGWARERDASLAEIEGLGGGDTGRATWKRLQGYHKRSLSETGLSRIKKMIGGSLKVRTWGNQTSEVWCKSLVINRMNKLGLPKGVWEVMTT